MKRFFCIFLFLKRNSIQQKIMFLLFSEVELHRFCQLWNKNELAANYQHLERMALIIFSDRWKIPARVF